VRNAYESLVRKSEGERQLRSCNRRWDDNVRMNLTERVCENVGWIKMARIGSSCAVVRFCDHGDAYSGSIKAGHFLTS
jgi:hypothetical protein